MHATTSNPNPAAAAVLDADYLIGLGALDERMLILVDIDRLMSSAEMGLIEKLAAWCGQIQQTFGSEINSKEKNMSKQLFNS